jgi:mutator family transposase
VQRQGRREADRKTSSRSRINYGDENVLRPAGLQLVDDAQPKLGTLGLFDGLKGFPEAINAVFPQTVVQTCIVGSLKNSAIREMWIFGTRCGRCSGCGLSGAAQPSGTLMEV